MAKTLEEIQNRHPDLDIGSYPFRRQGKFGCTLVSRGTDPDDIAAAAEEIRQMIIALGGDPIDQDLVTPEDENTDDY